jgi:hypothetical protein
MAHLNEGVKTVDVAVMMPSAEMANVPDMGVAELSGPFDIPLKVPLSAIVMGPLDHHGPGDSSPFTSQFPVRSFREWTGYAAADKGRKNTKSSEIRVSNLACFIGVTSFWA